MYQTRKPALLTALMALLLLIPTTLALSSSPASAADPGTEVDTALPLPGFSHILADPAHGHVFISGGEGTNGLEVADTAGTILETIPRLPGASGMVLSEDGLSLYVALANGDGIERIDTGTLATKKFATGPDTCPSSVVISAGLVWFGYGCSEGFNSGIGTLDPATGAVHRNVASTWGAPALASSPQIPHTIFNATTDSSEDRLTKYTVTGGSAPTATVATYRDVDGFFNDMAVSPDGADLLVADSATHYVEVFSTSDLSSDGAYTLASGAQAVAVSSSGEVAAGTYGWSSGETDVSVYRPGASVPDQTVDFPNETTLAPAGLAFGQSAVYAVTSDVDRSSYTLRTIAVASEPAAPLSVHLNKPWYFYGGNAHVTAHLPGAAPGTSVSIYATPDGQPTTLVKRGTLNANGELGAAYRMTRRTTFRVEFGGDPMYAYTSAQQTVAVRADVQSRIVGAYLIGRHNDLVHVHRNPTEVATVSPSHAGQCVTFGVQRLGKHGGWQAVGATPCRRLSLHSTARFTYTGHRSAGDRLRIRAEWVGDQENSYQFGRWQNIRFTR